MHYLLSPREHLSETRVVILTAVEKSLLGRLFKNIQMQGTRNHEE
jgi:hypothetical protein